MDDLEITRNYANKDAFVLTGRIPLRFVLSVKDLFEAYKASMKWNELSCFPITRSKISLFVVEDFDEFCIYEDDYDVDLGAVLEDRDRDYLMEELYEAFREMYPESEEKEKEE